MQQGTPEWYAARLGKVTASRIADLTAQTKSGWGASRANYMAELLCERLTGETADRFTNAAMQWGKDAEPQARAAYEFISGNAVAEVGFIDHPTIDMAGASPDGLVGDDGMLEIKCPNTATHIETLLTEAVPAKYRKQMLWQLACAGRAWCDFVSFDPRLPGDMQLFVTRIIPEDGEIEVMEKDVADFIAELDAKIASLSQKYGVAA